MGMDFVALMRYAGPDGRLAAVLDLLEAESPAELQASASLMSCRGLWPGPGEAAAWELTARPELRNRRLDHRPDLPTPEAALRLPEGFCLTFGGDAIEVYHFLRWHLFLSDPALQRGMLDACLFLGRLFAATECVITSDFSPVVQAFRQGRGFDESLASGEPDHGERPSLADLYWENEDGTWDSRGYCRLELQPAFPAVPVLSRPATAARTEGFVWATSGEPDAMLDFLLKRDAASRRKVLLWAAACVRRLGPLLSSEPSRRAVEVVERFADGQTTRETVANAAVAAGNVRKGNRRANHAARLLAELGSGERRFPPGDVAEAAATALAQNTEKREQANLLREVFGQDPCTAFVHPSWRTPQVTALVRSAYEARELPGGTLDPFRLALLADALEEVGCTDDDILLHLRGPGPHVRGCWAVDLLTGRE